MPLYSVIYRFGSRSKYFTLRLTYLIAGMSETREINNIFLPFFTVPAKSIPTATPKNSPIICINRVFSDNVCVRTFFQTDFLYKHFQTL